MNTTLILRKEIVFFGLSIYAKDLVLYSKEDKHVVPKFTDAFAGNYTKEDM